MLWLPSDQAVWEPRLALESRGRCDSSWVSLGSQSVLSGPWQRHNTWTFTLRQTKCWVLSVCQPKQSESCVNIGIRFLLLKLLEIDVSECWIVYVILQYLEWLCNGWLLFLLPIRIKCDIIQSHMSFSSNSQLNILFFPTSVWSFSLCLETVPSSQFLQIYKRLAGTDGIIIAFTKTSFHTLDVVCKCHSVIPPSTTTSCQVSVDQKPDIETPVFLHYIPVFF